MTRYLEVVHKEDIDNSGGFATIDRDDATRYEPLSRIAYPANNGHLDWTEDVIITYTDGTVKRIRGHVVSQGVIDE